MYHMSALGIDERMINVHYYYYYNILLHCLHHQSGSCVKMGSDKSHFNV